ncbi:MAG: hypothetical protein EAX90_04775 [Candidatus Heimdallarchaeota archaeon]|nr:hypothetical protein [Candidatus Heimdallarchaeota archaeon]
MENGFQFAMFIISPIVLILDAVIVSSGIIRKFARIEKSDESERTKLFSIVDVMEKIGIVLGVLTLMLAGYLAVKVPDEYPWLQWFNPITILFMCIIGALLTLRTLENTPITALIALLAGFLGAAIFAVVFGDLGQGKWIYFIVFLVIDIIVFILVRTLTQQMAMIGKIMNWLPVAITIAILCIAWGIFQIVSLAIWGVQLVLPNI